MEKKIRRSFEPEIEKDDIEYTEDELCQDRNDFFMTEVYSQFRKLFRIWGYKFARSIGMTPDEAEAEAIKIALEQTGIRMNDITDMTVVHILHATKQRMINLCNRNSAQKRNNYYFTEGFFCECGRKLDLAGICECGKHVTNGESRRKVWNVSLSDMRDEGNGSGSSEELAGFAYSTDHIKASTEQEDHIYLKEFMKELRAEMDWRFKTGKVTSNVITIYQLLIEDGLSYQDVCRLTGMEDSTFYLYRSRIMECYYAVKNRLERKFARKKSNK